MTRKMSELAEKLNEIFAAEIRDPRTKREDIDTVIRVWGKVIDTVVKEGTDG